MYFLHDQISFALLAVCIYVIYFLVKYISWLKNLLWNQLNKQFTVSRNFTMKYIDSCISLEKNCVDKFFAFRLVFSIFWVLVLHFVTLQHITFLKHNSSVALPYRLSRKKTRAQMSCETSPLNKVLKSSKIKLWCNQVLKISLKISRNGKRT